MKIKNRIWMCLLTMMLCVGMFSTTAFAYVDESATTETETVIETTVESETETETEVNENKSESTEETGNALTPDGNLTLVDDVGETSGTGKQFVTLVTKSGNYFYLIIDRDDEGNNTVHFLNQVDEADLFSLMEDDEVQKLQAELAEKEQQTETEPEVTTPEVEDEPVEEMEESNMLPAIATLVLLIGGAGVFAFMKLREKKKAEEAGKPDPDADYDDDMEYDFMDEDSFEDREDEDYTEEEEEM